MTELAIIVTARSGSERLPNKAGAQICGQPLLYWILQRALGITSQVILATTTLAEDDHLVEIGCDSEVPVYRGSVDDVVGRMEGARRKYAPNADYVLRGLGDCPFLAGNLVERAVQVMEKVQAEAFRWHLAPYCWPVYGAREFPYAREAWERICAQSNEREHVDAYYMQNIQNFQVAWHEPPVLVYFRPYRLEVDWPEDLALVRQVGEEIGMLASVPEIIGFLDQHQEIASLNRNRVEKTGPTISYDYQTQRTWMRAMEGKPVITWDNMIWFPPSPKAQPVFCQAGQDLIGFAMNGILYTRMGYIQGAAYLNCACGSGKAWRAPKSTGFGINAQRL